MVKAERLIKFPLPSQSGLISQSDTTLAFCVCYQHDFDSKGYGPYGFDTEKSKLIISDVFSSVYAFQKDNNNNFWSLCKATHFYKKTLYLYGNSEVISRLNDALENYKRVIAKNEIKARHSLPTEILPEKPLLLEVFKDEVYQLETLIKLISLKCGVFIRNSFAPEAGEAFILFDNSVWGELKSKAINQKVEALEVLSINELKPW